MGQNVLINLTRFIILIASQLLLLFRSVIWILWGFHGLWIFDHVKKKATVLELT